MPDPTPLLTRRQHTILSFARAHYTTTGCAPTLTEIAVACGLSPTSKNVVLDELAVLERAGWIRRVPGRQRGIEVLDPDTGRAA